MSAKIPLTLACGPYDRTQALATGEAPVEGVNLNYVTLEPEEVFLRMARFGEFDAAELSLSTFLLTLQTGAPFVGLPVFPSRFFRHGGIYVHAATGIERPEDLAGRLVGVAEYQLTANVWIRGTLQDDHGLEVTSVRYRTGGLNQPGRHEKTAISLPDRLDVAPIPTTATLSDMLVEGSIDAVYSPRAPDCFLAGRPEVRRLFDDVRAEEVAYYRRHGIFPIMHVVVLRRELYERHRWLARSLTKAFVAAKELAVARLSRTAALSVMLPWAIEELRSTQRLMGDDFWPYGLEANRVALEVFARYSFEQGLTSRPVALDEMFAPEALEEVIV